MHAAGLSNNSNTKNDIQKKQGSMSCFFIWRDITISQIHYIYTYLKTYDTMNRLLYAVLLVTLSVFVNANIADAITYTTAQSGNFYTPSTWAGGVAPKTASNSPDTVIISAGHDVILDNDYQMNLAFNLLQVDGTLRSTTQYICHKTTKRAYSYLPCDFKFIVHVAHAVNIQCAGYLYLRSGI